jgi:hypothetical protein
MNNLIASVVNVFKEIAKFYGEDGDWILENIKPIMEYLYNIPVGHQVELHKYIQEVYGKEKVSIFMGRVMPFVTGHNGILDISFETASGEKITARNWELVNEIGKENIKCLKDDGTEVGMDEVYLIYRRNSRME